VFKGEKVVFSPEQITAMILSKLKQTVEKNTGVPVTEVVLSVRLFIQLSHSQHSQQ
jgi:molecular chaperone DnaK (HSP70)